MFNLGGGEILVILLLALIVLGPQRLPEAARKLGSVIGEVRRMATGFQTEIKAAFDEVELTPGSTSGTSRQTSRPRPPIPTEIPEAESTPPAMGGGMITPEPGPESGLEPEPEPSGRDDAVA